MLIRTKEYLADCTLVRLDEYGKPCDLRDEARCIAKPNCPTCMWNRNYAEKQKKEFELCKMTKQEVATLRLRNKHFPITETKLRCLKPVGW